MSQFLLVFDKTTIFESFFFKIKSVTEYPNIYEFKKKDAAGYKIFLDVFNIENSDAAFDEEKINKIYNEKAIYRAEFARIAAICFGFFQIDEENQSVDKQIKSIIKENESDTIKIFWQVLDRVYRSNKNKILVGNKINVFDVPFFIKRFFKYRNELTIQDNQGKDYNIGIPDILRKMLIAKPWEQSAIDISNIWKFGGQSKVTQKEIASAIGYEPDNKEIDEDAINKCYWSSEPKDRESALKDIAMVGSSDIEIMMDFMTEFRTI